MTARELRTRMMLLQIRAREACRTADALMERAWVRRQYLAARYPDHIHKQIAPD